MMTKLVRPCTHEAFNDNEAFEAIGAVVSVVEGGTSNGVQQFAVKLDLANGHSEELDFENRGRAYYTYQSVLLAIYEALNAPVLATKQVLAGLPKDVQFLVYRAWGDPPKENPFQHCNLHPAYLFRKNDKEAYNWYFTDAIIVDKGLRHSPVLGFHIKSNGCPKTAKYLLQFYTDGTPVVVK